jgi:hypothetical protein
VRIDLDQAEPAVRVAAARSSAPNARRRAQPNVKT